MIVRFIKYRYIKNRRKHRYVPSAPPYSHCKNCGNELHGKYCSVCGQFAHLDNRPFNDSVKFYLEHHYALDHKLTHTLKHLFFHPGFLSREFMNGRIERHVHPFKLYLFSSILLFGFVINAGHSNGEKESYTPLIDSTNLRSVSALADSSETSKNPNSNKVTTISNHKDSLKGTGLTVMLPTNDSSQTESKLEKKIKEELTQTPKKILEERFFHYLSLSMFILMPLFGLLLMIFYRHKERYYTAHLIHSLHLHVVLFIAIILGMLSSKIFNGTAIMGWLLLGWFIYFIFSLSIFYKEKKRKSIFKGFTMLLLYLFAGIFAVISVAILALVI